MNKLTLLGKKIREYPSSPDEAPLETFANKYSKRDYWITFYCPEFTSICPKTAQPDFGTITIRYIPDKKCLEAKSLKLYLFSFRNIGIFNEDAVNKILDAIIKACSPRRAEVSGEFHPRGGISITVKATYPNSVRDKTPPHTIAYGELRGRQASDPPETDQVRPISNGANLTSS